MASGPRRANGIVVAAPRSGSGKTLVTLGLLAALRQRGLVVAPAKTGPDYIDASILSHVADRPAVSLDPWSMPAPELMRLAVRHAVEADLLLVEGVMGLFDAAADGTGSTADLAAALHLPVVLVVDAEKQSHSVAALVLGFARFRPDVAVGGVILNRVATTRHEALLRAALLPLGIPVLGALPRRDTLKLPERHLGLVLPGEVANFDVVVEAVSEVIEDYVDLNTLLALSAPLPMSASCGPALAPLGQRIAIAYDDAFSFVYQHVVEDWREAGAEITWFSPLRDEAADMNSDAIYLPGGYPELHGQMLASADRFRSSLVAARDRGALIYGECGGYMVLADSLIDGSGTPYKMASLLPGSVDISRAKRTLGYRRLTHSGLLPWPRELLGHEFHYSSSSAAGSAPLFTATDATGAELPPMGSVVGRVMGSYAHVIGPA